MGLCANIGLVSQSQLKEPVTFVSTLAHRQPSITVPHKRKSAESSDASSGASQRDIHARARGFHLTQPTSTPSPSSSTKAALTGVSVVIPSPDARQRKQIKASRDAELAGISESRYPTIDPEQKKASKRAYPKAQAVDRAVISLPGISSSSNDSSSATTGSLRANLARKLQSIGGPEVAFDIDDKKLAVLCASFEFVNEYSIQPGVTQVPDEFNAGCDCAGHCATTRCGCLNTEPNSDQTIVPYHQLPSGQWVLHPEFLARKSMIYECSFRCSCQGDCWNHVVQRGRQIRLEIFDAGARGLGLRSPDAIASGQFIDRYLGEVIPKEDADAREGSDQKGQSYLFSLDFIVDDDDIYVVDGQKFGSATRFMNHSCKPNCKIIPVSTTNHADDRLYYLAFFALEDINPGTELTFDYNPAWDGTKKVDPNAVKCLCGAPKCRGQLWPNARKVAYKNGH
ncbi:uncharacterized protein N7459_007001 [Penicillium hispanicum]|uniref:uncharacterized protein n=1 Tax=Penicillium hispanicum TaxID=1080232 RepID=UPI0025416E94|nr:uncharacterized protein N7459_007001 [Penicillium hispanicum]KAJ5578037.1 hypothetical protein N7459_007001 [Penicillium hispanicum]